MTSNSNYISTLLCIDTTTSSRELALFKAGELVSNSSRAIESSHTQTLIEGVDILLSAADSSIDDLSEIAVVSGPGSFSGIRIGISTALGLGRALQIPVLSRNALEILAGAAQLTDGLICPVLDARRGCVYFSLFQKRNDALHRIAPYLEASYPEAINSLLEHSRITFTGNGTCLLRDHLPSTAPNDWAQFALAPSSLAVELGFLLQRSVAGSSVDEFPPDAFYIRPPDIRHPRKARPDLKA